MEINDEYLWEITNELKDSIKFDELIETLDKEISFYNSKINPLWTLDENKGFKEGLKYTRDLIDRMKKAQKS